MHSKDGLRSGVPRVQHVHRDHHAQFRANLVREHLREHHQREHHDQTQHVHRVQRAYRGSPHQRAAQLHVHRVCDPLSEKKINSWRIQRSIG